ncbi:Hsp70 nucleotide exchange factor fes1 [Trematosphaeria pertusa]|uniref:Hsp70 nucleotide exchange factor fes1 n=1 Tax=Trematosphaeria pertusa TaxID=390896 RepID=A0A6A6IJX7_9PLEO|nr:Hsp70 nucleotide exchange factor fes1 [Trematosphaeria pertusa]KAF2250676.1 Hsp70 nucleotide exchange factor fes1 [Trematosphaeria pertusa]
MNDPRMTNLLKWSIENSEASRNDPNAPKTDTKFDPRPFGGMLSGFAGPSDAKMMKNSMEIIMKPQSTLEEKVNAFEVFEGLIVDIDNANNMDLQLWGNLLKQLEHEVAELRGHAASCTASAVENNARGQERLFVHGAIPTLVKLATEDENMEVRKKAIRALSSVSRNFQPALDAVVDHVPRHFKPDTTLDAGDMVSVDSLMDRLRADAGLTQ